MLLVQKAFTQDPDKIKATTPQTTKGIRCFLGMVNQMIKFVPNLADITKLLRDLLSTKNQWAWGQSQEEAFNKVKTIISPVPVLALFDPNLTTNVSSDTSSLGSFVKNPNGTTLHNHPRANTPAQHYILHQHL